jgi:type IV fimbrial biogenesis protein FimT
MDASMGRTNIHSGFTLVELMIALVLLVILVAMAAPSFVDTVDRRRVINATQALTAQIQQARSLAVTRNREVSLVIQRTSGSDWCFGLTDEGACDCTVTVAGHANACLVEIPDPDPLVNPGPTLIRANNSTFPGVEMGAVPLTDDRFTLTFEPTRGLRSDGGAQQIAADADAHTFRSPRGLETRVNVNLIGRVWTCSPSGATLLGGIAPCN